MRKMKSRLNLHRTSFGKEIDGNKVALVLKMKKKNKEKEKDISAFSIHNFFFHAAAARPIQIDKMKAWFH